MARMHVERQIERCRGNRLPQSEVYAPSVVADHPFEIHAQTLARGAPVDRREVLLGSRAVIRAPKGRAKARQHGPQVARFGVFPLEIAAQRAVAQADAAQGADKIDAVAPVECSVDEVEQRQQLVPRCVHREVVRGAVHQLHQFPSVADDRAAVAPGYRRGEEAGDLDILPAREAVRDGDRVVFDESGRVVALVQLVEQLADRFGYHIRGGLAVNGRSVRRPFRSFGPTWRPAVRRASR